MFLIFSLFVQTCLAEDDLPSSLDDMGQYSSTFDEAFIGQKKISDEEFQKTLEQLKSKQKKKKKDRPMKGKSYNDDNSNQHIDETAEKNIILAVPIELINGDGAQIPAGHYKIVGVKDKDNIYLDFYQAYSKIARVPAIETNADFDEKSINFVKILPYDSKRIKLIFGSIDFNAYTFIRLKEDIKD